MASTAAPVVPLVSGIARKRRIETHEAWSDSVKRLRSNYDSDDEETLLLTTGYGPIQGIPPGSRDVSRVVLGSGFESLLPKRQQPNTQSLKAATRPTKEMSIVVPERARNGVLRHGATKIFTPGVGLLCGLNALASSIRAQYPQWKSPTSRGLVLLVKSREFRESNDAQGLTGINLDDNFRADHLGLILKLWGESQQPRMNLRLGVIVDGQKDPTLPPTDDHPDTQFVWLHNDGFNLEDINEQDGHYDPLKNFDWKLGHFSGVRPKQDPNLPEAASSQDQGLGLRGGTGTTPKPGDRRRRELSPSPSEHRKRRRLAIQGDAEDFVKRKWAELKSLVEALVKDHFPPSMPEQFTQELRFENFRHYSPLAASITQSNSYGAYIFKRHIWWNLVWRMLGGHSRFWVGKEANTYEDVSRHERAKTLIKEQDRLYTTNAYHLATSSKVGAYIIGITSKENENIQAFLAKKATEIRDMYNKEVPGYDPDEENDPVNVVTTEILATFWHYLQLSEGIHDPGDVIVNDCVNIVQCAAEIDIMLRTQLAQYVVFFPVAGEKFMDDRCSLLIHPTQVVAGEQHISLTVTPALFRISNFAEPQTDADGNGFVIKADVLCNLVQQDVENE